MTPQSAVILFGALNSVSVPVAAYADAFDIKVLSATCSTSITFGGATTREVGCGSSQSLDFLETGENFGLAQVVVSADYFAATASSRSVNRIVEETADSLITFSPVTNGTAMFGVDFDRSAFNNIYFSLFDLTSREMLLEQVWSTDTPLIQSVVSAQGYGSASANDLYDDHGLTRPFDGSIVVPTAFRTDHRYALHLFNNADSQSDSTAGFVRVSGLVPVPEPSSLLLLGIGLASVMVSRRRISKHR